MVKVTRRGLFELAASAAALAALTTAGNGALGQDAIDRESFTFGWEPDLPLKDVTELDLPFRDDLPPSFDLSKAMPPVYNQGPIGSCVANAVGGAIQFARRVQEKEDDFIPSRMFLYYYARSKTGTELLDTGSRISNAMTVAKEMGVCKEDTWDYDNIPANKKTKAFPDGAHGGTEPSEEARTEALHYRLVAFQKVKQRENNIRSIIAMGFPVVFGFTVFSNMFEDKKAVRVLNVPSDTDTVVGGHAVLIVGYNDETRMFRIRNSWGANVHDRGYFDMSYEYVLGELSRDFWAITDTLNMPVAA